MRNAVLIAAATVVVTLSSVVAFAAPTTVDGAQATAPMTIDYYAFAGGRDATVCAALQAGRSVANAAPRAFTRNDTNHAFAPRGFATKECASAWIAPIEATWCF